MPPRGGSARRSRRRCRRTARSARWAGPAWQIDERREFRAAAVRDGVECGGRADRRRGPRRTWRPRSPARGADGARSGTPARRRASRIGNSRSRHRRRSSSAARPRSTARDLARRPVRGPGRPPPPGPRRGSQKSSASCRLLRQDGAEPGGREPCRRRSGSAPIPDSARARHRSRGRVELIEPGAVAAECGPAGRREPAPEAVVRRRRGRAPPRAARRPAAAPSGGSRPCAGGAHGPASGASRPTPASSARRRASNSVVSLSRAATDTKVGQRPRARDRVLQLQGVGQRQLQDALQIRVRSEPLQGVGAPDRPLAPAAQAAEPARLGGGLAGLGRVPEALRCPPAGPAPGRAARSGSVPGRRDG